MKTLMDDSQISTLEQVREFLEGTDRVGISISSKAECYRWVQRTLIRFEYLTLGRSDRGVLLRYLCRVSGYSRAQVTRLVQQYREHLSKGERLSKAWGPGLSPTERRCFAGRQVSCSGVRDEMAVTRLAW